MSDTLVTLILSKGGKKGIKIFGWKKIIGQGWNTERILLLRGVGIPALNNFC